MPNTAPVTVAIPVGPYPANKRWLGECLASIAAQTRPPEEILIIDDDANLVAGEVCDHYRLVEYSDQWSIGWTAWCSGMPEMRLWRSPWHLGVAHAFNFGVALARNDLVFLMGSDDTLEPECLEKCVREWEQKQRQDAYYYVGIRYSDTEEAQDLPCGYAMVTKGFWRATGGFPVESAIGAPDTMLISILLRNRPKALIKVAGGEPLVAYRRHQESATGTRPVEFQGPIHAVRDILTRTWKRPEWPR